MQLEHGPLIAPCWAKVKLVLCQSSGDASGKSTKFTHSSYVGMDCTDVVIEDNHFALPDPQPCQG